MKALKLKQNLKSLVGEKYYDLTRLMYRIFKLKVNSPDENSAIISFHRKIIRPDDVVFDIGSNKGFYTYNYSKMAKNGYVYSFEPIRKTFDLQQKLLRFFKLKNYKAINIALGNQEGEIEFVMPKTGNNYNDTCATIRTERTYKHFTDKEIVKVQCFKLNSILEKEDIRKVDFVKIDVEGAELLVFQGANKMLEMQPIIFSELLERHFEKFGYKSQDIIDLLKIYNYESYYYSEEADALVSSENNKTVGISDCYFIPESKKPALIEKNIIFR